ncbi:uncharacterized protein FOMMEDRAFT_163504 [Fomitiporia mediterranea MF3/22]|uniref:Uncharacterized protein n=1 Tax=Fomitiporia mediterranea (strain MF3/22) TaxID=694068 RepID=R7SFD1_FOMME|nr:uncharacterized protein FOMMEDRAFT_163504 [Fomitiporia mediterranea MF3/22]EJC97413.1 hypothetical protein FOMMEDRAFT_163504 [Fomitiporia mediterranea MF3/22]
MRHKKLTLQLPPAFSFSCQAQLFAKAVLLHLQRHLTHHHDLLTKPDVQLKGY